MENERIGGPGKGIAEIKPGWKLWAWWVLATVAVLPVVVAVLATTGSVIAEFAIRSPNPLENLPLLVSFASSGAMIGITVGFVQWLVLRRYLRKVPNKGGGR